jgi:hypothetical protein
VGRRQAKWRRSEVGANGKADFVFFLVGADLHNFNSISVGAEHRDQIPK